MKAITVHLVKTEEYLDQDPIAQCLRYTCHLKNWNLFILVGMESYTQFYLGTLGLGWKFLIKTKTLWLHCECVKYCWVRATHAQLKSMDENKTRGLG